MMSVSAISQLQREATAMAAELSLSPIGFWSVDTVMEDVRHSPFIGEYVHPNWKPASYEDFEDCFEDCSYAVYNQHPGVWIFCDATGLGDEDEPALTFRQLVKMLERCQVRAEELGVMLGTGIVEEGQFQIHLGLFVR